jgi:hypothetical protein
MASNVFASANTLLAMVYRVTAVKAKTRSARMFSFDSYLALINAHFDFYLNKNQNFLIFLCLSIKIGAIINRPRMHIMRPYRCCTAIMLSALSAALPPAPRLAGGSA